MAQPEELKPQSKTEFKRFVAMGALCSKCLMPANIHGGYVPCQGAGLVNPTDVKPATGASK